MRGRYLRSPVLLGLTAACLLVPAMVLGQAATGSLAGTVTDGTAPVPGVTVTVTNPATGFTRNTVSDADGSFRFPALPVGRYTVKAELSGFATVMVEGVEVIVATARRLEVTMKPSKVAESVTVTAEVPLVETSPSVGMAVSQNELQSLPLNGRQFANLAVMAPGTNLGYNNDPTKPGQLVVQLNGGSGRNVNYIIDGGDNTDDTIGGQLQNFNLESVQEFKIQTMQYKAEYGRSSGGVLTVISKGGTNDFHGGAWEFGRRKSLNSETESERLSGTGKADYTRDQYGFSIGGPIVKDKIHFFVTGERTKAATNYVVNTGGAFPTYDGLVAPLPFQDDLVTAKVTYDVDAKNYLQVRYGYQKNSQLYGQGPLTPPSSTGTATNKYSSILAGYTTQISADKINEFIFQYTKFVDAITANSNDPYVYYPSGFVTGQSPVVPQHTLQTKYQYKDDFSFSKTIAGKTHDFKTGFNWIHEPLLGGDSTWGTTGQYTALQDKIGSPITNISIYSGFAGNRNKTDQYSVYFQDDWRFSSNLTFNLGLRYDYFAALNLDQRTLLPYQVLSTQMTYNEGYLKDFKGWNGILHNEKTDWSPRLGFSWDIEGNGKKILRGGAGRFYDFPYQNATILFESQEVQSASYGLTYSYGAPNGIKNADGTYWQPGQPLPPNQLTNPGVANPRDVAGPTLKPPYSDQYSLGYSWQATSWLGLNFEAVSATYRHIPFRFRINPIDPATGQLRFPTLNNRLRLWYGKGEADYQGLNIGFHLRGEKFEVQGFYTLSSTKGNVLCGTDEFRIQCADYQPDLNGARDMSASLENPDCPSCRGPLNTDARHRVTIGWVYQLPYGFSASGMWRYHSATPYTEWTGVIGPAGFNFNLPPGVSVNSQRGHDFSQFDLRVSKDFKFAQDIGAEVLAEVFNVFNSKNPAGYAFNLNSPSSYGNPSVYAGDPLQGEQRLMQVGLRFHF
jgi:outer membrane receptor protein involved in Fe transport